MGRGHIPALLPLGVMALCLGLLTAAPARGEPDWVVKRPRDATCYIGIGVAAREGKKADYREKARLAALRDLASEIAVTIDSSFLLRVTETTGLTEEEVRDETRATLQARLTDVEFVDDYNARGEFWVYYRLARATYQQQRQTARLTALSAARAALADSATPAAALRAHLQALAHLAPFVGEPEPAGWQEESVLVALDRSHAALSQLLTGIRLESDQAVLHGRAGSGLSAPFLLTVTQVADRAPIAGLPVRFAMSGTGALTEQTHSDAQGQAACHIGQVNGSEEAQIIRAAIDLERLAPEQLPVGFFGALVERLPVPRLTVPLKVFAPHEREAYEWHRAFDGRSVHILAAYRAAGKASEWFKMRDELATHVQACGGMLKTVTLTADQMASLPASPAEARPILGANANDVVVLAVADGQLNRRPGAGGEAVSFSGNIRTSVARGDQIQFSDTYQGAGGFNPMGEAMCMDVLGLQAIKRWKMRYLAQLGKGE